MNRSSAVASVLAGVGRGAGEALGRTAEAQGALSLTPVSKDFGSFLPGTISPAFGFTVTNRGAAATKSLSVALGGNGASNFAITANNCVAALSPGQTCSVSISFAPRSIGAKAASLDIRANPGGMIRSSLSGTGSAGTVACPAGQTMQAGVCVNLPAGSTTTNCPSGVADGSGGCTVGQLICSAGQTIQNGICVNLPAGATTSSCPSGVANGSGGCTVTQITCSAGQTIQGGVCVNLPAGTATTSCPSGVANGSGGCGALSVGPSQHDFGSVRPGATSNSYTFTIVNHTPGPVSGMSVALLGTGASWFAIASSTCGTSLPGGGTCTVAVRFSPPSSSSGGNFASLEVAAASGNLARASLRGTATP